MERAFGPEGDHGRWWNNPKAVERLKLTDEQRKAFDGILLEHREKLIDLRPAWRKAELVLEPLMGDDQPNEAQNSGPNRQGGAGQGRARKSQCPFSAAIRGKLTPEQWEVDTGLPGQPWAERHGQGPGCRGPDGQGAGGLEAGWPGTPPGASAATVSARRRTARRRTASTRGASTGAKQ